MTRIKISCISLSGAVNWSAQYWDVDKNLTVTMLADGRVTTEWDGKAHIRKFSFSKDTPTVYIDYEEGNPLHKSQKIQHEFWLRCPLVRPAVGKNTNMVPVPLLILVDESQVKNETKNLIALKGEVFERIKKAGPEGRKQIAIYYGVPDVDKKDDGDLWIALADFNNGKLMNSVNVTGSGITLMEDYLENYKNDALEVTVNIDVKSAIEFKLIETRGADDEHRTFLLNNIPIGKTIDQVSAYLINDSDQYAYLKRMLKEKREIIEKQQSGKKSQVINQADDNLVTKSGLGSIDKIRARAKDLGIPNWHNRNAKDLIAMVDEEELKLSTKV